MIQLTLPGVVTLKSFSDGLKYNRKARYSLEEGIALIKCNPKKMSPRIKMFATGKTECVVCGIKGSHFYEEHHVNDKVQAHHLNLYGYDSEGNEVLMTWDHILPRSLGGGDTIENSQCMCVKCNGAKGNLLSIQDLVYIASAENVMSFFRTEQRIVFTEKLRGHICKTIDAVKAETTAFLNQFNVAHLEKKKKKATKKKTVAKKKASVNTEATSLVC